MAKKKILKGARKKMKKFTKPDLKSDRDIAMDFATKVYQKFDKMIKAIILFGSSSKGTTTAGSDIDIIILIDDASIKWDQELIAWYRGSLGDLVAANKYKKNLHVTTTRVTTWWSDLMKGDPTILNILRYGESLIDSAGFFNPIKALLLQGRISSTLEAIYMALQRAPEHFRRSKLATLGAIEGLFWAMVDSSQAALMAVHVTPPSPEHIPLALKEQFVDRKLLKMQYVDWFKNLYDLHKKISHGEIYELKGDELAQWQDQTEEYIGEMAKLVSELVKRR